MTNRVRLTSYLLDMIGSIIEKVLVGPPSWSLATLIKFQEHLKNGALRYPTHESKGKIQDMI